MIRKVLFVKIDGSDDVVVSRIAKFGESGSSTAGVQSRKERRRQKYESTMTFSASFAFVSRSPWRLPPTEFYTRLSAFIELEARLGYRIG